MRIVEETPSSEVIKRIRQRVQMQIGESKPVIADLVMIKDGEHRFSIEQIIATPADLEKAKWKSEQIERYLRLNGRDLVWKELAEEPPQSTADC